MRQKPLRMHDEDRALAKRMLEGDEEAFEQLFGDHFGGLYRFALTRLRGDEELAKEIVQSTVCVAIDKLDTYRGEASLFTWLCSICRFEISAWMRRRQRAPAEVALVEELPEVRTVLESLAVGSHSPEEALQRKEMARLVHLTLDHLPARYGRALEWKYFDAMPVKEIAARLDIGPKAAESVLSRAREAFRTGFAALGRELDAAPRRGLYAVTAKRTG